MARIDLDQRQFDRAQAKLTQAIKWQRKALAANPVHPGYRQFLANHLTNLIEAETGLGSAEAAAEARRQLDELQNSDPQLVALDARLAVVLKGKESPRTNVERIQLAYRAGQKSLHLSSARLFTEALAEDRKLADDRQAQHRYNAACAAALAASGEGKNEPAPDDAARAKLRQQARDWLKAELAVWAKLLESGPAEMKAQIAPILKHWETDAEPLRHIREQKNCSQAAGRGAPLACRLWNAVDRLLSRADSK